jgi:hypothetical protein
MPINLRADNRALVKDAKFSYLLDNYASGVAAFSLVNTEGFYHNSYILVGNVGSENTEILQLRKVNPITNEVNFTNFTATAIGSGILTVAINTPGTGYQIGEILTVIHATGVQGSVRVANIGVGGAITAITVDQPGYAYTVVNNNATTGGGNNDATINILTIGTASTATSILFSTAQQFIAGQPVEVFNGSTGASRGTGTVSASSDPASTTMALTAPGIAGTVPGDTVEVGDVTRLAHSESTRITVIQYNQIRFFRTDTPVVPNTVPYTTLTQKQNRSITQTTTSTISNPPTTTYTQPNDPSSVVSVDFTPPIIFSGAIPLTSPLSITVNDFYTVFIDTVNSDGYGWFAFYNSSTALYSPISAPIPYAGFDQNTVKKCFEAFDSSLNTKELKLITQSDRYNWLNEGLSYMTNELNMVNYEYAATEELSLNLKANQAKYLLPQDFSDLLFINDSLGDKMDSYTATFQRPRSSFYLRYAIRGKYIIFYPTPDKDQSVTLAYLKNAAVMKNMDDVIDLPNQAFYAVKDFMRYRAYQKLNNSTESANSFAFFKSQIDAMKIHAIKRDDGLDSWSIASYADN